MQRTAMIVDDEAPMRDLLRSRLRTVWPDLQIVAEAANGIAALEQAALTQPDVVFLDIRMPGKNGIEAAAELAGRAQLVFVTAYNDYAIAAFERGAMDYLLKPVETDRLQQTCARLQQRLQEHDAANSVSKPADTDKTLSATALSAKATQVQDLLTQLMQQQGANKEYLRWIQASVGNALRMISTKEILYFKSDEKYTLVQTAQAEYLIRKSLKELEDELDPQEFWRIHRSAIVSVSAIAEVSRDFRGRLMLSVKGQTEKLEVSRNHTHLFQQM
ncbi:LytR/AlgR family response regulator transcription factor [Undibacterium rugosum]|uniref:LytR/AlgR family response regulator transcription factor n=1 Tax=Undibacterium rugosum TaxID=2762291 RepID=UPI001B8312D4|nr:LytTR family DNA-binding domain-containing protein [Undibacterium rugosum]MBR7777413.1 response regulator transcription factor [Undibacterium rugosum]